MKKTRLPVISGQEAVKAFSKTGWIVRRQTGSHSILKKEGSPVTLSIPQHTELKRGTLRNLIADSDMSVEDFIELL